MRVFPALFAAGLCLATALPLSAQAVHGTLLDTSTGEPIAGAHVSLRTGDGDPVRATLTGVDGSFRLTAPRAGEYHVFADRIGYLAYLDGPVRLAAGETVEIRFELSPQPIALDGVAVTATARVRQLENAGFYRRKQEGFGHFIEREQIEKRRPQRLTDLLRPIPGVQLLPQAFGRYRIVMRGGADGLGELCTPRIYLDGFTVQGEADDLVVPWSLEALEVYRGPAEAPAQYGGVGSGCGVILLWTRR